MGVLRDFFRGRTITVVKEVPVDVIKYKIVELEKPRPVAQGWDKESRETVMTLAAHPGFLILTDRLKIQSALLKQKLSQDRHNGLRDVEFLQSGIFWCNWLTQQLAAATTRAAATAKDAMKEDEDAFKELQSQLVKLD